MKFALDYIETNKNVLIYKYDTNKGFVGSLDDLIANHLKIYKIAPNYLLLDEYTDYYMKASIEGDRDFAYILSDLDSDKNVLEEYLSKVLEVNTKVVVIDDSELVVPTALKEQVEKLIIEYMQTFTQ